MSFILLVRERLELARIIYFFVNFESFIPVLPPYRGLESSLWSPHLPCRVEAMACLPGSSCRVISFGIPHPHQSMSHSFPAWTSQAIQRRWGTAIVNRGASAVWASFRQICLVCEWNTHRGKRFNVIPLFARVGNWGSARVSFGNDLWLL